jgi:uncharacterized RDD family membrane protein YckC
MKGMHAGDGQLDNTIEIITPENIAFRYQVAGPFRRVLAYLLDVVIRAMVLSVVSILVGFLFGIVGLADLGMGLLLVFWFVLAWFYGGLFETFWNGQTPGKRLMQIRVLTVDGQPINGLQAVLRNLLRAFDQQPAVFCVVGLVAATLNHRFQRLGDLAAGTMVVVEERPWFRGVVQLNNAEAIRLAAQIPAGFQASRTLAQALAAYVQRRLSFPEMRKLEIAQHIGEPLREKFNLPPDTNLDLLLCGLYQRTFITDRQEERWVRAGSPFAEAQSPFAPAANAPLEPAEVVILEKEADEV